MLPNQTDRLWAWRALPLGGGAIALSLVLGFGTIPAASGPAPAAADTLTSPLVLRNFSDTPGIVELDLTAAPTRLELVPGKPTEAFAYNGKDTPGLGLMAGTKNMFACRKISDSSFEVTTRLAGKPMYVDVYTVSADGKTLTDHGTPSNAKDEPFTIVFDRQ